MEKRNSKNKIKIYVVIGPTAVGKSDYAVDLAKKINGEVISADSRQVYKGLDVATGKITKKEMCGIPHFLLDVANPKKQFSVSVYVRLASKKIEEIHKRGHVPIVCGGTGFYVDTLIGKRGFSEVEPNKELRNKLVGKSPEELFKILCKLDPKFAEKIDRHNPVRLLRAIEIAEELGSVPEVIPKENYDVETIYLDLPDEELKKRIELRTKLRFKRGMIAEAKRLHQGGLSYRRMNELGLEYRFLAEFLRGKIDRKELEEKIVKGNWDYVGRQRTWWKSVRLK